MLYRKWVAAALTALSLSTGLAAAGVASAAPNPCAGQEAAYNAVQRDIQAHNARKPFLDNRNAFVVNAYNAEAQQLGARQDFTIAGVRQCYSANGINRRVEPNKPTQPEPKPAPPRPVNPSPSTPTPGYPVQPRPVSNPAIARDNVFDTRFGGSRVTQYRDGGQLILSPINGRAASGATGILTRGTVTTRAGTVANGRINPPGWDPAKAYPGGQLQRLHLLARRLGGSGDDARNLMTGTVAANRQMTAIENTVARALVRGDVVFYNVTPIYGRGFAAPPTQIIVSALSRQGSFAPIFRSITNIP